MGVADAQIVSQIVNLEPLAGAGLAINLAYLALDRFRYRGQIEPQAEKRCVDNDEKATLDEFQELEAVRELQWLARRETSKVFTPKGSRAMIYRFGFRKHQDVNFSIAATFVCGFTMVAGVADNVGRWEWIDYLAYKPIPGILFYLCLLSLLMPAVNVMFGRRSVAWGLERITYCTEQVAIHLKALATNATAPVAGPPAPPGSTPPPSTGSSRNPVAITPELAARIRAAQARRRE